MNGADIWLTRGLLWGGFLLLAAGIALALTGHDRVAAYVLALAAVTAMGYVRVTR